MLTPKIGYTWDDQHKRWCSPDGTPLPEHLQPDAKFLFGDPSAPVPERVKAEWNGAKRKVKEVALVAPALM